MGEAGKVSVPVPRLRMVEGPLRDAHVERLAAIRCLQAALVIRQKQGGARAESPLDGAFRDVKNLLRLQHAGQFTRKLVQGAGTRFAVRGHACLEAQAGRQVARDQSHGQHHAKGDHILEIAHGKRETRWHENEIEAGHAHQAGQRRRPAPQAHGHQHHRQQRQHGDIGQVQVGLQGHRGEGRGQAGTGGQNVAPMAR